MSKKTIAPAAINALKEALTSIYLGASYYSLGSYEDAIDALKLAVKINPDDVGNHYNLGGIYHLIGDKKSALNEYEILKELNIDSANKLFDIIYG